MPLRKAKSNYKAVMVVKIANGFREFKTVDVDISKETFSFDSKSYKIDLTKDVWINRSNITFLFYIIGEGTQLTFKEFKNCLPPEILDDIMAKNILGQIVGRLKNALGLGDKYGWVTIVVLLLIGGVAGYFVGANYGAQTHTVIQYLNQTQGGV
jgi:hypothetical protein